MILEALRTGYMEGNGPYYKQVRAEIRPRPERSFKDRLYGVAMSPDTAPVVGELGGRMMFFIQFSLDQHLPGVELYREAFRKHQHRPAPPPLAIDFTFCDRDAGRAEEMTMRYAAGYYLSVIKHYEFNNDYLKRLVDHYVAAARIAHRVGFQFVDVKQCHRYLLSELLAAKTRPGPFGGSLENRTRLARDIITSNRARACSARKSCRRSSAGVRIASSRFAHQRSARSLNRAKSPRRLRPRGLFAFQLFEATAGGALIAHRDRQP